MFSNDIQPITVVIMLDCSGSMLGNEEKIRDGAAEFVRKLRPDDKVRIGNFGNDIRISPSSFTGDRQVLMNVLETDLQEVGPSPVWAAVDHSIAALLPENGRRVVLLFSDGKDDPAFGQDRVPREEIERKAQLHGIMIYAIGFPSARSNRDTPRSSRDPAARRSCGRRRSS